MTMKMKNRIRECRKSTGMTPEELGKAIGLTGRVIVNYENGFREPSSLSIWEELASTLHVSPAYLVGWSDEKKINHAYEYF